MKDTQKAKLEDPHSLRTETTDPVERAAALSRLVADERIEFEPDIVALLVHHEPLLRAKAIVALVGRWRMERYVAESHRLLASDPDWLVRSNAASALSMYVRLGTVSPQVKDLALRALTQAVQEDPDVGVKEAAYEAALRILGRPISQLLESKHEFDPQQDIDWNLLMPYSEPPQNRGNN